MIIPSQLALKTHTNLGCAASFATLDKLVDKFTLPPAALPIGDASLTHVIKLAAHSTTSPTPTAMRQLFIFVHEDVFCAFKGFYCLDLRLGVKHLFPTISYMMFFFRFCFLMSM
jgi:hypothetical protein